MEFQSRQNRITSIFVRTHGLYRQSVTLFTSTPLFRSSGRHDYESETLSGYDSQGCTITSLQLFQEAAGNL
jgi:hypothetical protein